MADSRTLSRGAASAWRAWCRPVANGLLVGFTGYVSTVPLVIAALVAAGAQREQVIAALAVLGLCMGVSAMVLSTCYRSPFSVGWSTGAAALLVAQGPVPGGLRAAAGAFLLAGLLTMLSGLSRRLAQALRRCPQACAAPCWRASWPSPVWCRCGRSSMDPGRRGPLR